MQVEKGSEFYSDDYNEAIKESIDHFDFQPGNTLVTTEITLKGTKYRKGMIVLLSSKDEGLEVGRIKLILVHQNSVVYFVTEKRHAVQLVDLGVYCIADEDPRYVCVLQEELLDYYPLQEYKTCGLSVIVLHHSFPSF